MSKAPNNQPLEFHWSSEAYESLIAFIGQLPWRLAGVYMITSPSGKKYVGSSLDIRMRLKYYRRLVCRDQRRLFSSFRKYGVEAHTFEILELCRPELLFKKEATYGAIHAVLGIKGLNCALPKGDEGSPCLSEETKLKISRAKAGAAWTTEARIKASATHKAKGTRPPSAKGRKASDSTRELLKRIMRERVERDPDKYMAFNKIVNSDPSIKERAIAGMISSHGKLVLNTSTGIFYETMAAAAAAYNLRPLSLREMLLGRYTNSTDLVLVELIGAPPFKDNYKKAVLDTKTGEVYKSISEAAAAHNIPRGSLNNMLYGKYKNWTDLILAQLIALLLAASVLHLTIRPP